MPISVAVLKALKRGRVFVETGCDKGEGIAAALDAGFEKVISIELDADSVHLARERFVGKPVTVLQGDTVKVLPRVLAELNEPATFWLDAHATEWSPVLGELLCMTNTSIKEHTILIDDRRLMVVGEWFTPTESAVYAMLLRVNPQYVISLADGHVPNDIIVAQAP